MLCSAIALFFEKGYKKTCGGDRKVGGAEHGFPNQGGGHHINGKTENAKIVSDRSKQKNQA